MHYPKPYFRILYLGLLAPMAVLAQTAPMSPVAPRVEHKEIRHGEIVSDDYFWLREKTNPKVRQYLQEENAYTEAMTKDLKPFQETLYKEMVSRLKQTDMEVPVQRGAYLYYTRTEEGKQYPIHCRKAANASQGAKEELLLDRNEMAQGKVFLELGAFEVSDDSQLLAFSTDSVGYYQFTLQIKNLTTGKMLPDAVERATSVEWGSDNRTLFFTTEDPVSKRSNQLWRMVLGGKPELVAEEKDERFFITLSRTKDKQYFLVKTSSNGSQPYKVGVLKCSDPTANFKVLIPPKEGLNYDVEHRNDWFYIRTNEGGKGFRVVKAPVSDPNPKNWQEFLPAKQGAFIERLDLFRDFAVVRERSNALTLFRVLDFQTGRWRSIDFPEKVYAAWAQETPEFGAKAFRIKFESLVTPTTILDVDMKTLKSTRLKQQEVMNGYDPKKYVTERLWVTAHDGARIPVSIVTKKGFQRDGSAPLWLYAYGSYGSSANANFIANRISLLDRGVGFAIAHIRGGKDLGVGWYEDGKLMKKMNTFTDFIDCGDYLVREKWVAKDRLAIQGISAGGLLVGAVANMRPDLFKAIHAGVPFVDVMNDMWDASLPLTTTDYLEWGNPNEKAAYDYMKAYSPYDNIEKKAYPAMLVTTSFHDSQVMYWGPVKYVAKLRAMKTDTNELLLQTKLEAASHGGASGRYDQMKDQAFIYAWMLKQLGITK